MFKAVPSWVLYCGIIIISFIYPKLSDVKTFMNDPENDHSDFKAISVRKSESHRLIGFRAVCLMYSLPQEGNTLTHSLTYPPSYSLTGSRTFTCVCACVWVSVSVWPAETKPEITQSPIYYRCIEYLVI